MDMGEGGVSRKGEEAYWCFSAPIKPGWFMKCVTALGLYVFSATSSMTPTAASNRISRSVSLVRNLLRCGDQLKCCREDTHLSRAYPRP